jgi:hypothetical protein
MFLANIVVVVRAIYPIPTQSSYFILQVEMPVFFAIEVELIAIWWNVVRSFPMSFVAIAK